MSRDVLLMFFGVLAVAGLVYASTLHHASFRADDFANTEHVATPAGVTWDRIAGYFYLPATELAVRSDGFYRPVYSLSWALDYAVWGSNPFGFVLTNVLLHALSAALVAFIVVELSGRMRAGLLAGLLFALFPTHPFSMNYAGDRPNVLASALFLLALLAYLRFRQRGGAGYLPLACAALALALLSKETAASLPVVAFIYEVHRKTPWRKIVPYVGALGATVAGYVGLRFLNLGTLVGGYGEIPSDVSSLVPTLARYLGLMLAPYNPNLLGGDYSLAYLLTLAVMVGVILTLALRVGLRDVLLFLAALLAVFLPSAPLFMGWLDGYPGYGRFEQNQHVYLASAFFCAGLALLVFTLAGRGIGRVVRVAVGAGLATFYLVVQVVNNQPWLEASDLVREAQRDPDRAPVSMYLGTFVFPNGQGYEQAMRPWFGGSSSGEWRTTPGTLTSVDRREGEIELGTPEGRRSFELGEEFSVRVAGEPTSMRALKRGCGVHLWYTEGSEGDVAGSAEIYGASLKTGRCADA